MEGNVIPINKPHECKGFSVMRKAFFEVLSLKYQKENNPTESVKQQYTESRKILGNLISKCVAMGCRQTEKCTLLAKNGAETRMIDVSNIRHDPGDFPNAMPMGIRSFQVIDGKITEVEEE